MDEGHDQGGGTVSRESSCGRTDSCGEQRVSRISSGMYFGAQADGFHTEWNNERTVSIVYQWLRLWEDTDTFIRDEKD